MKRKRLRCRYADSTYCKHTVTQNTLVRFDEEAERFPHNSSFAYYFPLNWLRNELNVSVNVPTKQHRVSRLYTFCRVLAMYWLVCTWFFLFFFFFCSHFPLLMLVLLLLLLRRLQYTTWDYLYFKWMKCKLNHERFVYGYWKLVDVIYQLIKWFWFNAHFNRKYI